MLLFRALYLKKDQILMILRICEKIICIIYIWDFCKLENYPELFSKFNDNVLGKCKYENPETLIKDEFCEIKTKGYIEEKFSKPYIKNNWEYIQ